jgi:hypothetical protein
MLEVDQCVPPRGGWQRSAASRSPISRKVAPGVSPTIAATARSTLSRSRSAPVRRRPRPSSTTASGNTPSRARARTARSSRSRVQCPAAASVPPEAARAFTTRTTSSQVRPSSARSRITNGSQASAPVRTREGAARFQRAHHLEQVLKRAGKAVELDDDQGIAGTNVGQQARQHRPAATGAGGMLVADRGAACGVQFVALRIGALVVRRHPRIPNQAAGGGGFPRFCPCHVVAATSAARFCNLTRCSQTRV